MKDYKLKKRLKNFILTRVYKKPEEKDVRLLLQRLRPVKTDKELIRLGGKGDGGYLVPNDIENVEACFSPGVGANSSFEKDCAKLGMEVFLADASVTKPSIQDNRFHFQKKFIGSSRNRNTITLAEWVNSTSVNKEKDLMLQMDIEGHEYDVLNSSSLGLLKRFRIIIVEFHGLEIVGRPYFFQRIQRAFDKLSINHTCVHIHPNNCCGLHEVLGQEVPGVAEFTFLRNDRIEKTEKIIKMPHPLDMKNLNIEDINLPENWYK